MIPNGYLYGTYNLIRNMAKRELIFLISITRNVVVCVRSVLVC